METKTTRPHTKGDFFNDRKITFPFEITNARIDQQFRLGGGSVIFAWSTEDATFEKISDTEIIMKGRILNQRPGNYTSDLQITFPDDIPYTYFRYIIPIVQDITVPV